MMDAPRSSEIFLPIYDTVGVMPHKNAILILTVADVMEYIVMCFERHVSEIAFLPQRIRSFVGSRLVEIHIRNNTQKELQK
jgi:hypothetical protein